MTLSQAVEFGPHQLDVAGAYARPIGKGVMSLPSTSRAAVTSPCPSLKPAPRRCPVDHDPGDRVAVGIGADFDGCRREGQLQSSDAI